MNQWIARRFRLIVTFLKQNGGVIFIKPLEHPDILHLQAAQGWMELGNHNHLEAHQELEKIAASLRAHPDVLQIRWQVYAQAKKWEACLDIASALVQISPEKSDGWVHRSFSLHALKRT